ncbi:GH1 family beta-glucosidase [Rugosimonospora africana]|uniref:Beta-glucosidase n=1 Tax=Rugosimonospora africana TaxID=556532 RepID=A0A8J3VSV8_9ACTN|nr:GH1 family beta-glucosidase [Rugosimonospora africana]GIH17021.1 beta-glucosidase [Rugosimonospora africana]
MFPKGFRWGASTAAYQIEGASSEGGRGPSIWDTFSHEPGRITDGSTGDVTCDHYHRYREDIDLLAGLGVDAYRFSIAWPRIQPDGTGPVNPDGVAFYDRLVDALLERGIDPVATLFHWDLPQALQDRGGWFNRETAYRFGEYADHVGAALGDRVRLWITLNEPFVHTVFGHGFGFHAPGEARMLGALPTAHHQLLGHGLAVAALRTRSASPITIANNHSPVRVIGDSDADRAAGAAYDALHNRLFVEPLLGLGYPEGFELPVRDGDLDIIAAPIDALGVNYYNPTGISAPTTDELPFDMVMLEGYPMTDFGWPVVPEGLTDLLTDLHTRYGRPMYVTESGCAYERWPEDPDRIEYLSGHVEAVRAAIAGGADVRGYFVWSIMDNFEWTEGFTKRFGLVHVDFDSQVRTPRSSYHWYRDFIASTR